MRVSRWSVLKLPIRLVLLAATLAIILTILDAYISMRVGLLAYPPVYDGIGYVLQAKSLLYRLDQPSVRPVAVFGAMLNSSTAPLWEVLMLLNFLIFGVGEWQSYVVRFWPTFLLLTLVLWVTHGRGRVAAVLAIMFTSLLPTISVDLRACVLEYWARAFLLNMQANYQQPFYMSDLRPDLMFSVLLLWTIVPLVKNTQHRGRLVWLVSGVFAALAILTKTSTSPTLLLAWVLAGLYIILINRQHIRETLIQSLCALIPFGLILTPWVFAGGAYYALAYTYTMTFGSQHVLWLNPNPGILSDLTYYWRGYSVYMGLVEGWSVLVIGVALSIRWFLKGNDRSRTIAYFGIPLALWFTASITPDKNLFLGLPFYLLLWVFSWIVVSSFLRGRMDRRLIRVVVILIMVTYAGFYATGGIYAVQTLSAEEDQASWNRQVIKLIAADLRSFLNDSDYFMWAPAYGIPATLQYYMMDARGDYPKTLSYYPLNETPSQFIDSYVKYCKAVLSYEQDIQLVEKSFWTAPLFLPYLRAVSIWVREPASSYDLANRYLLRTPSGLLTLDLFVKHQSGYSVYEGQQTSAVATPGRGQTGFALVFQIAVMTPRIRASYRGSQNVLTRLDSIIAGTPSVHLG